MPQLPQELTYIGRGRPEFDSVKAHFRDDMIKRLEAGVANDLRQKREQLAREFAPIEIGEFPC